ncbi:hypothetical protein RE428_38420 [Marinobacter nanhaiticus D15-8W]|uniref:Uncharacterized protein n=1 Tax=Marinobacter nanhaiticus D15-8W TaxID=626887 RepID=N6WYX0_9GAMM|nr:hypothetical protein [Marinobacter nanhaiticus]ENO16317.1 hypothetical protein J057_13211 [Marinobacter nanhaiticus D15-8W]BES72824.1 hypothetical protein RE428_38420 [Marinobacter nanhaiticus D15-8W]
MATRTKPIGPVLLLVASLLGIGISLYYYLTPLTGVNGTFGALLVVVSTLLMALAGLLLLPLRRGFLAGLFRVLALLAGIGTLAAAWFLHEFWLMAAMVVALLGVIVDFGSGKGGSR